MINTALVTQNFRLLHTQLYRIKADGTLKLLTSVVQNRLVAHVDGQLYQGPDLAWVLLYGSAPMFQITQLNGDPFDFSVRNLVPIRIARRRFNCKACARGFHHILSPGVYFPSIEVARQDWAACVWREMELEVQHVLELERARDLGRPADAYHRPMRTPRLVIKKPVRKPPADVPGRLWYWHANQWVSVPPAICPADDYKVRCQAFLDGATHMKFDSTTQQCFPVFPGEPNA
jgi:hypothetical protein